jgi:putative polyketide hydroxylase
MVAADGARSGIRKRLGIGMDGAADLGSQRMIAFRADLTRWTSQTPRGIYFLTDANAVLIWTHPDHRWVLHIPDNGSATADRVATIREAIGDPDVSVEVLAQTVWTAAAQTATRYARGPTFLVGDAAHRFPPAGATGVSTAMHDAHNLAWKLAAAQSGRAGDALLDTYCQEREPVGRRNVEETGAAWSRIWRPSGAPFAGRSLRQIDMGYQYHSAAVTQDGSPDADPAGADYAPSAGPGCRAPHLRIETQRGRLSTIDLFDRDFVLLTAEPGAIWRVAAETVSLELGVPIISHLISEPEWHYLYGISPAGAVLVRPDGHVVWRRRTLPTPAEPPALAQFQAALATATCTGPVAAA